MKTRIYVVTTSNREDGIYWFRAPAEGDLEGYFLDAVDHYHTRVVGGLGVGGVDWRYPRDDVDGYYIVRRGKQIMGRWYWLGDGEGGGFGDDEDES